MTTKLSGDVALAEYVGRAKGKVYTILRSLKTLGKFDINIFFKLFDCQVVPALLYASEVWGLVPYERMESVHLFACKKVLGVGKQAPNCLVYGETGRYPLYIEGQIRALKYWFRVLKMEDSRLPKLAYTRELNENKQSHNWVAGIKALLERSGFAYIWETGCVMYLSLIHI